MIWKPKGDQSEWRLGLLTPKFKKMDKLSESVCLLLYIMIYIYRYSLYPPPLSRIMRINTVYKSFTWKLYPQVRTTYSLGLDILPLKLFTHWVFMSSFSSRQHADVSLWCHLWNFGLIQEEQFSFDTKFFFWVRFHIAWLIPTPYSSIMSVFTAAWTWLSWQV